MESTITFRMKADTTDRSEVIDIAAALFEVFWQSKHSLNVLELSIDGVPVYGEVRQLYVKQGSQTESV